MRRGGLLSLVAAAAAVWSLAGPTSSLAKVSRIGIIDNAPVWDHFRTGLRELGYVEGQTVAFEYRSTGGKPDHLAAVISELVNLPVDILVTFGTPQSLAAKKATSTIPVVMISIGDPIGTGLVASFARPGGNLTGNTILGREMAEKRLQIIKDIIPGLSRLAFLRNPGNASNMLIFDDLQKVVQRIGVKLVPVNVRSAADFETAFAELMRDRPDILMSTNDPLQQLNMGRIIDLLARHRLPGMFQARENVLAGGLLSYGASLPQLFRRGAFYVHRILQGTKPSDLPIEQPTKFELVVNLRTAKTLGLAISESFLLQADEVIE